MDLVTYLRLHLRVIHDGLGQSASFRGSNALLLLTILDFSHSCFDIIQAQVGHLVLQAGKIHGDETGEVEQD